MKLTLNLWVPTLIMFVLKITGFITWSWWVVFSPIYVPLAIAIALGMVVGYLSRRR